MKKILLYIFILNFCFCFSQNKTTISQALNIASKQSMLCERLAKEKIFHVTNPNNYNTDHKLGVSLIQFELNISRLKNIDLPEETLFLLTTTEMLWFTYKKNLLDKDHISAIKTMEYNKVILFYCKQLFNSLIDHAKTNKSYPFNISKENFSQAYIASNKLKYLSQKLSLYYNAYYSKVNDYDSNYFNNIILNIDTSISEINQLKKTNNLIKEKTNKIENEWTNLKLKIQEANKTNFDINENYPTPEYILKQNNELLKDADLLARYYREYNETNK